jgi:hypothetical protein
MTSSDCIRTSYEPEAAVQRILLMHSLDTECSVCRFSVLGCPPDLLWSRSGDIVNSVAKLRASSHRKHPLPNYHRCGPNIEFLIV